MQIVTSRLGTAIVPLVLTSMVAGCATTTIRSQVNPQFFGQAYSKIMVVVGFEALDLRQDAESQFRISLRDLGTEAVRAVDLFPPGQDFRADEVLRIVEEAGIQAVLVVASRAAGTQAAWIHGTTSLGGAPVIGRTEPDRSPKASPSDYAFDRPWATYEAALHDVSSDEVVWTASMSTGGNMYARWDDLARSMAKTTSEQLAKDGLIR